MNPTCSVDEGPLKPSADEESSDRLVRVGLGSARPVARRAARRHRSAVDRLTKARARGSERVAGTESLIRPGAIMRELLLAMFSVAAMDVQTHP